MSAFIKPKDKTGAPDMVQRKKRRMERSMIVLAVLAIIGLTILQTRVVRLGTDLPMGYSILVFILINVNIVLLFLLLVLVLRNLYKIFFEQRRVTGGQLWTKLVIAFVSLSLLPTGLLFYAGMQFISTGHDYWFDENVERSLTDSLQLAQYAREVNQTIALDFSRNIATELETRQLLEPENRPELERYISEKRREYNLVLVEIYTPDLGLLAADKAADLEAEFRQPPTATLFHEAMVENKPQVKIDADDPGDLYRVITPLGYEGSPGDGFLVVGYKTVAPIEQKTAAVDNGLIGYRELKRLHDPIRVSHFIALTIVALLSLFISTWIGLHLAKSITGPIMELAQATQRISHGDYDFSIDVRSSAGEIGTLVSSFNRMTQDLKKSEAQLTEKNLELSKSNTELDQRREYMEIVLQSVAAGVISADADGVITTMNKSAQEILRLNPDRVLGRHFQEIMVPEHLVMLEDLLRSAHKSPRGSSEKQIRLNIGGQNLNLLFHLTQLRDESGAELGLVIVFDDLSELEKAQRMAAWREVARRIAHEIKNPLTPIQLSAQRLRKRYGDQLKENGQLFDECTLMIIRQVDELKRLVNEFNNFARMPQAEPTLNDLTEIVAEVLVLYADEQKNLELIFKRDPDLPPFNLDREQMKRVLINLMDNAVAAVENRGRIVISLHYDALLKMARLEVADDGIGISPSDKRRLFEPYFSTKKSGTGLGLAIVSSIVADHDGFVRVQDNQPRGTRFIIELPVRT